MCHSYLGLLRLWILIYLDVTKMVTQKVPTDTEKPQRTNAKFDFVWTYSWLKKYDASSYCYVFVLFRHCLTNIPYGKEKGYKNE